MIDRAVFLRVIAQDIMDGIDSKGLTYNEVAARVVKMTRGRLGVGKSKTIALGHVVNILERFAEIAQDEAGEITNRGIQSPHPLMLIFNALESPDYTWAKSFEKALVESGGEASPVSTKVEEKCSNGECTAKKSPRSLFGGSK